MIEMYSSQAPKIVDDIIAQLNSNESNRIIIGLTSLSEMIKKEPRYGKLLFILCVAENKIFFIFLFRPTWRKNQSNCDVLM